MSAHTAHDLLGTIREEGYCIIPGLLPRETLAELDADLAPAFEHTPFGQGDFYGVRTKRFGGVARRSPAAADLILQSDVLDLADQLLGPACDRIQLNVAQAIAIHPGEIEQFPHCDHDMWPCAKNAQEYLLNVIWPLTRFTAENGATRIYPGTHKHQVEHFDELPQARVAACEPGDAICFLGSTVHGAGQNASNEVRRAVVVGYSLGWLKPYENPTLAYPPDIARNFPKKLTELVGYVQHRPNLGNYEGTCPSILLKRQIPDYPQATDTLRPDQELAVSAFARDRRGSA